MATITVNFERCIQNHQVFGSNDEMMVSRIFFSIDVKRRQGNAEVTQRYDDLRADLKQAVGGSFGGTPIEVGYPNDLLGNPYSGPISYERFQEEAERYYRGLMSRIGIDKGSSMHMSAKGNVFHESHSVTFESD